MMAEHGHGAPGSPRKPGAERRGPRETTTALHRRLNGRVALLGAVGLGAWAAAATGFLAMESWRGAQERAAFAQAEQSYAARLDAQRAELARLESRAARAAAMMDKASAALAARQDALTRSVARERSLQDALRHNRERLAALDGLQREAARLAAVETDRDELGAALSRISDRLSDTVNERDHARALTAEAETSLAQLELTAQRRERLLEELGHAAELSIAPLEGMLRGVGVDIDALVRDLKADGAGGPFVPASSAAREVSPTNGIQIAAVISDMERVNLLRAAADRMPFAKPVGAMRISSRFGRRRDPLNRRAAMHEGVDFRGPLGAPISATASGVVTFSGRQRGYGNIVKIRHDFGFETVYAHLNRRRVPVGARVDAGDRIGDMGTTGRSTGVHLHYEIRVNGRPVDPMKFIEASRNVL